MKLLVINWQDRLHPQSGGAEVHLHTVFGRLAAAGHEVVVLTSGWAGGPARAYADGMEIHRTGNRRTFPLAAPSYYARHLRDREFDVVVEDLTKLPLMVHRWCGRPTLLLVHHLFGNSVFHAADPFTAAVTWCAEHTLMRSYRGVPAVTVSESTADDLAEHGLEADRVRVIRNGVDGAAYTPTDAGTRAAIPTFVYVGRLARYKGVDVLLNAAARVRAAGQPLRVVIAGVGPDAARLQALAHTLGLDDIVDFPGFVTADEKCALLRSAWVHVIASEKEGWGLTVLEAAACGTPTLASDVPGLRDAVVHGRTGWLVPSRTAAEFADVMRQLAVSPERVAAAGAAAREYAELHSWDATVSATEALLREVAQSRDTAARGGRALRVRPRPANVRTTLPRCGTGALPFDASTFTLDADAADVRPVHATAQLASRDAEGRWPSITFSGLPDDVVTRLRPPFGARPEIVDGSLVWSLYGWPDDPEAWLHHALRAAVPGLRVRRADGRRREPATTSRSLDVRVMLDRHDTHEAPNVACA